MREWHELIVAPITAVGGAVCVVRLDGDGAAIAATKIFRGDHKPLRPRRASLRPLNCGEECIATLFPSGASYTGNESVELSVHGSVASAQAVMNDLFAQGARMAKPGEFTLRAFLNGNLELTQAEGVRETVNAQTEQQLRAANALRQGALMERCRAIREELVGILAMVEASTDFSEEIGELDTDFASSRVQDVRRQVEELLEFAPGSRVITNGVRVAIVGLPNRGKSSLLNALVEQDRAIVTAVAGTTRDTIEVNLSINGFLVTLIDTAGIRETEDEVEKQGVDRSRQAVESAELCLCVFDGSQGILPDDQALFDAIHAKKLLVGNKSDLGWNGGESVRVSALQATGLDDLRTAIQSSLSLHSVPVLVLPRHRELLLQIESDCKQALQTFEEGFPPDLATVGLRSAIRNCGEITGETASPDVLQRVFADFCIGK